MEKILFSSCLLGNKIRYNGTFKNISSPILSKWIGEKRIVGFCPELEAGFPVPRPSAEIVEGTANDVFDGKAYVIENNGIDVSKKYIYGVELIEEVLIKHKIKIAVLLDGSPTCGSKEIYDGTFTGTKIAGEGLLSFYLRTIGIKVFTENEIEKAQIYLDKLENECNQ